MRQLRGFRGLANYYRKFIKNFVKIAAPLNKHLNARDKAVLLSDDATKAFERLKQELTNMDYVLSLPDFDLTFILETDASDNCLGAALIQKKRRQRLPYRFLQSNNDCSGEKLL